MNNDEKFIPIHRFRRELNKWMRYVSKKPKTTIILTRNNVKTLIVISPKKYTVLLKTLLNQYSSKNIELSREDRDWLR